jgi:hypothetical protein
MLNLIRTFLHLGVIIGPLPNNILDGQLIDAVPVMNDFNWIVSQVNANVPALVGNNTFVPAGSVGGTANAITLAPNPVITAYAQGQTFTFIATNFNTSATTIQTSGLPTRAVKTAFNTALTGQEIQAGGIYTVTDTGTNYILTNGAQGGPISFSPFITFGNANTGATYSRRYGYGFKVNNIFYFNCAVNLSAKGSSTGFVRIAGLPYTIDPAFTAGTAVAFVTNLTYASYVVAFLDPTGSGNTVAFIDQASGGAGTVLDDTACTNTTTLSLTGFYPTV